MPREQQQQQVRTNGQQMTNVEVWKRLNELREMVEAQRNGKNGHDPFDDTTIRGFVGGENRDIQVGYFSKEFCPTGEGGGVDPSCSPDGSGGGESAPSSSGGGGSKEKPGKRGVKGQGGVKISYATPTEFKRINEILKSQPAGVTSRVKEIGFLPQKEFNEATGGAATDAFGVTFPSGQILFNRTELEKGKWKWGAGAGRYDIHYAVTHEIGHVVYNSAPKAARDKWRSNYENKKVDRFTAYSKANEDEGFAESYHAYVKAGGKAKNQKYSETFKLISEAIKKK